MCETLNLYTGRHDFEVLDCVFCRIARHEIPAKILFDSDDVIAFLDAFPLAKGHSLVIPKQHYEKIQDMPPRTSLAVFDVVHGLASKVDSVSGSMLVAVHNGKQSGQEVPHVHVHLIPRRQGDGAGAVHSMFHKIETIHDDIMEQMRDKLKL